MEDKANRNPLDQISLQKSTDQYKESSYNIDLVKELTTSEDISQTNHNWNNFLNNEDYANINSNHNNENLEAKNAGYAYVIKI